MRATPDFPRVAGDCDTYWNDLRARSSCDPLSGQKQQKCGKACDQDEQGMQSAGRTRIAQASPGFESN